jgi:hypothetical protein
MSFDYNEFLKWQQGYAATMPNLQSNLDAMYAPGAFPELEKPPKMTAQEEYEKALLAFENRYRQLLEKDAARLIGNQGYATYGTTQYTDPRAYADIILSERKQIRGTPKNLLDQGLGGDARIYTSNVGPDYTIAGISGRQIMPEAMALVDAANRYRPPVQEQKPVFATEVERIAHEAWKAGQAVQQELAQARQEKGLEPLPAIVPTQSPITPLPPPTQSPVTPLPAGQARPVTPDLKALNLIDLDRLKRQVETNPGNYPPGYLRDILERISSYTSPSSVLTESQRDLNALPVGGVGGAAPYSPYAQGPGSMFGGPSPFSNLVERPVREPLSPIFEPVGQSPFASAPSPGFSSVTPSFFKKGGSVSKRELDSLPGYQAGGSIGFSPRARVLPSERRFMDERLGEYEAYNRQVEPYNRALEDYQRQFGGYQSAYDKYVADVGAYNRAAEAYNAGPRTEDFAMQQPSFTAQAPQMTTQAPVMPDFTPEQFQQYRQQAQRRAGQRASALNTAFDMGIAPEVAQYFRRGIV